MPNVAGDTSSFKHSESDKKECEPPCAVEYTLSTLRGTAEDRYASADESLGLSYPNIDGEVMKKKVIIDQTEESGITHWQEWGSRWRSRSRSRRMRVKSSPSDGRVYFPPLLSTLNINGRQRYDFIRSVENGRLRIRITPNERPELVAQVDESRRLRLILITSRSQLVVEQDDHDEIEEGIVECCLGGGGGGDIEQKLRGPRGGVCYKNL